MLDMGAYQPAGRRMEREAEPTAPGRPHLHELGSPLGQFLHHDSGEFLIDVDRDLLDRLLELAVRTALEQHLRPRYAELEALAPHGLDQDRELELAASRHLERILVGCFLDAERHIALGLA